MKVNVKGKTRSNALKHLWLSGETE